MLLIKSTGYLINNNQTIVEEEKEEQLFESKFLLYDEMDQIENGHIYEVMFNDLDSKI